jgi:hypothetical protein
MPDDQTTDSKPEEKLSIEEEEFVNLLAQIIVDDIFRSLEREYKPLKKQ